MISKITVIFLLLILPFSLFSSGAQDSQSATEIYNRSLEQYRAGEWEESLSTLEGFAPGQDRELNLKELELRSALNYRMAEAKASEGSELEEALKNIDSTIGDLSRMLEMEPEHSAAANNLEMALKLKESLNRQSREQSQSSSSSEESLQDELEQLANEQRDLAGDESKENEDHKEEQNDLNRSTEDLSNRANQDDSSFNENLDKARDAQQQASEALQQGDFEEASEKQNEAADYLEQALAELQGDQNGEESSDSLSDSEQSESDDLIQAILESEIDRDSDNQSEGDGIAVERNW